MIEKGININFIFSQINDIVVKTCIAVEPYMLNAVNKSP
jgi:hypothetical protein